MSIRFAASRTPGRFSPCSPIARALARGAIEHVANDDGNNPFEDTNLRAALHHFAEHGLGAAKVAHEQAETALAADDVQGFEHWAGITHILDRRLARQLRQCKTAGEMR